jgi:tetratricopeptide (TPR) repeat protein
MSLSKPVGVGAEVKGPLDLPSPFSSRGAQLCLLLGLPLALATGLGLYYWWAPGPKSLPPEGEPLKEALKGGGVGGRKVSPPPADKPLYVRIKEEGNGLFRAGDFGGALETYARAMREGPPGPELATLHQNRAAVFEKLEDWVQVIREATAALELNPKYVKALQRRAKALRLTGFSDEALEDITAVCILEAFQHHSSIATADEILKEIGLREASDHAIASFLRAFHNDPVTKWWAGQAPLPTLSNGNGKGGEVEGQETPGGDSAELIQDKGNK